MKRFLVITCSYLDFLAESRGLDLYEGCGDCPHVAGHVVEGDAARADGILVLVGVQPCVDHATEEVIENYGQGLGRHHPVQGAHKHRGGGIESVRLGANKV